MIPDFVMSIAEQLFSWFKIQKNEIRFEDKRPGILQDKSKSVNPSRVSRIAINLNRRRRNLLEVDLEV